MKPPYKTPNVLLPYILIILALGMGALTFKWLNQIFIFLNKLNRTTITIVMLIYHNDWNLIEERALVNGETKTILAACDEACSSNGGDDLEPDPNPSDEPPLPYD